MDWALDHSPLSLCDVDLRKVFRYEPGSATVIRLNASSTEPRVWVLNDEQWKEWILDNPPAGEYAEANMTLVLVPRRTRPLEPDCSGNVPPPEGIKGLPFSLETFRLISKHLSIHSGISRVVNRADVGVISTAEVETRFSSLPSLVYHCRSSNMWEGDLALSVTHCVESESTFGMLFGCTTRIQEEVINRLRFAGEAIRHPLLLPGIFVELERNRHVKDLVEKQILSLENTISDLTSPGDAIPPSTEDTISLWLDTTALRNGLTNWKEQIRELICHLDEIALRQEEQARGPPRAFSTDSSAYTRTKMLANTSRKIRTRLVSVVREYEESIRDCNMRIEGVAMATQLLHAKTNLEIAVDAKRDGKRIQNISLFSVIFLPSMFVATIFSTDFFNWFPGRGEAMISPHIWILFTFCLCVSLAFLIGYVLVSSRISCIRKRQFIKRGCDVFV